MNAETLAERPSRPARRRPGARRDAGTTRPAHGPGPAVPPAAALRGPHPRGPDRQPARRRPRRHRRRGAARRSRVPPPARAAACGSPTARVTSPCGSFTSPPRSRRHSCAGSACAASARCAWARAGLEIVHPEYRRVTADAGDAPAESLTPVYPTTEGVQQGRMRVLTDLALALLSQGALPDLLPPGVLDAFDLPALDAALRYVHRPPPDADLEAARGRPPPRAASPRVRGTAGAPDQPAPAAAGGGPRSCVAAAATFGPRRPVPRSAAVPAHRRAAPRLARDRGRPRRAHPDDAARAGRRRLGQDRGRRARGAARGRARRAGRA